MTNRIFRAICIVTICIFIASTLPIIGVLYDYFSDIQFEKLEVQATLAAKGVTDEGHKYLSNLPTEGYRITWIDKEGKVIYDSKSGETGEDLSHFEDVKQAMAKGEGKTAKHTEVATKRELYFSKRLSDGTIVRLSDTQYSLLTLTMSLFQPLIIIAALTMLLAIFLAYGLSRKIVKPLNELNLDNPLSNTEYEELKPLLNRIDSQQKQLKYNSLELKRRQDEFQVVTDNMNEGLVLLSDKGIILSINHTATRLLSVSRNCVGKDIYKITDIKEINGLLKKAIDGTENELTIVNKDEIYQFNASPILSGNSVLGVVLLIFNITEKEKAGKLRREFTANVSHELKTPLHSISGCAELLKSGMVKSEDVEKFSGQIYQEAQRLISLIDDIIKLSRLDESSATLAYEKLDLQKLAKDIVKQFTPEAEITGIKLSLKSEPAFVYGELRLLSVVLSNLCDNAMKYNRENGEVLVSVEDAENGAVLSVKDTGIGIPQEHQERIFERFYRVDKSHSKEVGGTGLGLSIVKHAVLLHNAEISLSSKVGEGTEITIKFPKCE